MSFWSNLLPPFPRWIRTKNGFASFSLPGDLRKRLHQRVLLYPEKPLHQRERLRLRLRLHSLKHRL